MGMVPDIALLDDLIKRRLDEILPQKLEDAFGTSGFACPTFRSVSRWFSADF